MVCPTVRNRVLRDRKVGCYDPRTKTTLAQKLWVVVAVAVVVAVVVGVAVVVAVVVAVGVGVAVVVAVVVAVGVAVVVGVEMISLVSTIIILGIWRYIERIAAFNRQVGERKTQ